jgi:hypothetical protein
MDCPSFLNCLFVQTTAFGFYEELVLVFASQVLEEWIG